MKNNDYVVCKNAIALDLIHSWLTQVVIREADYIDADELQEMASKIHDWATAAYDEVLKDE